jgi:hypothetical protein
MSVSAISSPPPQAGPAVAGSPARTADGDYRAATLQTSRTRDSDGDYKPLSSPATAQSSPEVQTRLTSLRVGG